ncbi:MAG: hypothetical protein CL398_11405 [Acidiferrobacteraceae bacterium]|nr:hypothetical protein [Acidiferrobacteraceae bacterium]
MKKEVIDNSRRRFIQGKVRSETTTGKLDPSVELFECSRAFLDDLNTPSITYGLVNRGNHRTSVLVKYIVRMPQVIKLLHLAPKEVFRGTWNETIPASKEPCSIEIEARCGKQVATQRYKLESL